MTDLKQNAAADFEKRAGRAADYTPAQIEQRDALFDSLARGKHPSMQGNNLSREAGRERDHWASWLNVTHGGL